MDTNALGNLEKPVILVAEDDPDQSDMLRETLEDEGYSVETAFSGDATLHKLNTHRYALAILDIRMPGLDGTTVLKHFRQSQCDGHTPVIIVSAFANRDELQRYRTDGADASFAKPYEIDALLAEIRRLTRVSKG